MTTPINRSIQSYSDAAAAHSEQKIVVLTELPKTERARADKLVQDIMASNPTTSSQLAEIGNAIRTNSNPIFYAILSNAFQTLSCKWPEP